MERAALEEKVCRRVDYGCICGLEKGHLSPHQCYYCLFSWGGSDVPTPLPAEQAEDPSSVPAIPPPGTPPPR